MALLGLMCKAHPTFSLVTGAHRNHRLVTTWSPLASVFNKNPVEKLKWRMSPRDSGLFCIPELTDHKGFYLLQEDAVQHTKNLVTECCQSNRSRKLVEIFDELSDTLCKVADMADFVRMAHPKKEYSQAAEDACVQISSLVEKLNTNARIHKSLNEILQTGQDPGGEMDAVDVRVAQLFMFDFQQSGIHLPKDQKKKFIQLNQSILMFGTHFQQGCQKPSHLLKSELPNGVQHVFSSTGESITVSGLHSDHPSDLVREAAYRIYLYPNDHQMELLDNLLSSRDELAKLVGFPSYASRALGGTLGGSPENVKAFLDCLNEQLKPKAAEDALLFQKMKIQAGGDGQVMPWDPPFYAALARHQNCKLDSVELSAYFSLGCCMDGLNNLFQSLYGVSLQAEEPQPGEVWSTNIYKLSVVHETEGHLGTIYCDFFERPGKAYQDCHFTIRGGRQLQDGTYQNPVVVLMLNFPAPKSAMPSLLTPGMLENLFHEFGHAMHSMLGRTRYQHVTGTRCPTDFAEVPSVLMEYFATDPRVVKSFACHWQTGQPLPEDQVHSLCLSKRMFASIETQLQVFYSTLDQRYHSVHPLGKSTTEILADVQKDYYLLPYVPKTAWQLRFGHFVGYGAKYYSYLMSRSVASRLWLQYLQQDPFSRSAGEKYRSTILSHGGAVHPAVLIHNMLNEVPSPDLLANALIEEIDSYDQNFKKAL